MWTGFFFFALWRKMWCSVHMKKGEPCVFGKNGVHTFFVVCCVVVCLLWKTLFCWRLSLTVKPTRNLFEKKLFAFFFWRVSKQWRKWVKWTRSDDVVLFVGSGLGLVSNYCTKPLKKETENKKNLFGKKRGCEHFLGTFHTITFLFKFSDYFY